MGYGDAIMATALARGLHAQGKLAAFFSPDGNHRRIKWTGVCEDILKYNPNVAKPHQEMQDNLVWHPHYKKVFSYTHYDGQKLKWIWNMDFRVTPGEMFFGPDDLAPAAEGRYIVIEPNVAWQRRANLNKDWGDGKYERLAIELAARGYTVVQCIHGNSKRKLRDVKRVETQTFRRACAVMRGASLVIAPEGGNHHAAAAVGVPAIILWGGWSPPQTMGYDNHVKLTGGAEPGCGNVNLCSHCRAAFDRISVEEVLEKAVGMMNGEAAARPV